ncbi:hypothetical protein RB195_014515 [Necator americanus]|uniref:Uncharacterized protein n=1 Tax=Necator americanus TaxID=51031 RepID=A0ABR1E0F2_NECAM
MDHHDGANCRLIDSQLDFFGEEVDHGHFVKELDVKVTLPIFAEYVFRSCHCFSNLEQVTEVIDEFDRLSAHPGSYSGSRRDPHPLALIKALTQSIGCSQLRYKADNILKFRTALRE